jgi:sialate O-acetylesterase
VGDPDDLHPKNKGPVGDRLAMAAEAIAYGRDVVCSGPVFDSMKVEGDTIRLSFKSATSPLTAKGGGHLQGFVIAGNDRKFVPATARIEGHSIIVSGEGIAQPVAVRYAFEDNPTCNLFNAAGLPASPFRTDHWPLRP